VPEDNDEISASSIQFRCSNGYEIVPKNDWQQGEWIEWNGCPNSGYNAICGFSTQLPNNGTEFKFKKTSRFPINFSYCKLFKGHVIEDNVGISRIGFQCCQQKKNSTSQVFGYGYFLLLTMLTKFEN